MKKSRWSKWYRCTAALCLAAFVSTSSLKVFACGPFIDEAVLTFETNPDLPLKKFLSGELGVIRPKWAKSYLVVAYRELINRPLSAAEKEGVYALWRSRIGQNPFSDSTDTAQAGSTKSDKLIGPALWQKTRSLVPGAKPVTIGVSRSLGGDSYQTFLNCPDGAFEAASKTLTEKIAKHGKSSPVVKDWMNAQDLVFCHCGTPGGDKWDAQSRAKKIAEPPFPELLKASSDAEAAAERQYQRAAALFYAEQFDAAFSDFEKIAGQHDNPYAKIARYMMPRCLLRKATLTSLDKARLESTYTEAGKLIRAMLSDPSMAELHSACKLLLGFAVFRSNPDARLKELSDELLADNKSITAEQYFRTLDDYTQLLLNLEGGLVDPYSDAQPKKVPIPPSAKKDDLSDWITIWESDDNSHFTYALDRWHKNHSDVWLLAALHLAPKDKTQSDELLAAAEKVKAESPAYLSFGYEITRLHLLRGDSEIVANESERLKDIALKKQFWSAANLFMDLRGKATINLNQFVANSVRIPAAIAVYDEYLDEQFSPPAPGNKKSKIKEVFGFTNAEFMNERMPLNLLTQVALSDKLPPKLRADAEQAAWVRAVVLGDSISRDKLLVPLERDYPKLLGLLKATGTGTEADKKFAAAYLILKTPGMQPYVRGGAPREEDFSKLDTYADNWWDKALPDQNVTYTDQGDIIKSKLKADEYPGLLTSEQAKLGLENKKQLLAKGAAPTFLCAAVADYAATHKSDTRVPEALYLAVRASRYGHKEARTTAFSKQCFQLLHTNYPKNPYVAKTPYFY